MSRIKPLSPIKIRSLQDLGLSESEAQLYVLMLSYPKSTVKELVAKTSYPRTMLYYILKQLIARGIVSSRRFSWKTVYVAEDPQKLYDLLGQKEAEVQKQTTGIKELIPNLRKIYKFAGERTNLRVFEGVAEYEKALEDIIISHPKEIYVFENMIGKKPGKESRESFDRRRILKKIKKNVLFFESVDSLKEILKLKYNDYTNFRGISEKNAEFFNADIALYSDKVLYTNYYDEYEPIAVLIEDKNFYNAQKAFFNLLWNKGTDRTLYYTEANKEYKKI